MSVPAPHFLLFSEARRRSGSTGNAGRWRFVLEAVDGADKLEATDVEPGTAGDRLDLLAVVRGLEALDQPSRVTLVTTSRYVSEGLRYGLSEWRETNWHWECFGKMVPIKNQDLWQRIDRAMRIHQVECRILRFDEGDAAEVSAPILHAEPFAAESDSTDETAVPAFERRSRFGVKVAQYSDADEPNEQKTPHHRFAWALNLFGSKRLSNPVPVG